MPLPGSPTTTSLRNPTTSLPAWAVRSLRFGAVLGGTGVALGAFGAHALSDVLTPERLETFETAVRYQLVHALALIAIALASAHFGSPALRLGARLMTVGVAIFAGTLYLLVATGIGILGAVTPLGGAALIGGWICLFVGLGGKTNPDPGGRAV